MDAPECDMNWLNFSCICHINSAEELMPELRLIKRRQFRTRVLSKSKWGRIGPGITFSKEGLVVPRACPFS